MLPGVAEPIVTPEEQAAVTRRLELNKLHSTRRNMHPEAALLRGGHLVCGHCGWTLSVSNATPASRSLSPQYRCTAQRQHGPSCPRPSISASLIDGAVWAKVCEVLRDPAIIAAQVAKHREDGGLERQLATVERAGATITEKQARTAKAISLIADDEAAAPLLTELQALAAAKRAAQSEHDALQRRIADQAAERARMTSLSEWCGTVAANLDTLSYDEKRLALAALGVRVQAYRLGTSDAEGTPYPRWELTMAPVSPDPSIVYESTR